MVVEKRRTKYEKLVAVNKKLADSFSKDDNPGIRSLGETLGRFGPGLWEEVRKKDPSVTRSQITDGLEQGLRDLPMLIAGHPPDVRSAAFSTYRDVLQTEYPDFVEKDKQRLAKILLRGSIRSDGDWYLVQHRVDEIEGVPDHEDELGLLYKVMAEYDGQ